VFACVGGSFAACGIIAWHGRPDSRSGALMTAAGFAFFLPALLGQIDSALAATVATLVVDLWSVLLVSLLSAGRLESTIEPAARLLLRAAAADPRVRLAAAGRGGGAEPAAGLSRPGGRGRASTRSSGRS
jgi:hypothetical protein